MRALQSVIVWQITIMPLAAAYAYYSSMFTAFGFYLGVLAASLVYLVISILIESQLK